MQRMVGPVIALVGAVAIGGYLVSRQSARADAAEAELSFTRLQRDHLEKVGWIRAIPDETQYRTEVNPFLAHYFKGVEAHRKRHGGNPDFDDYVKEREARGVKDLEAHRRHWQFVKTQFDLMRGGSYAPVFSGADKGMRLDVVSADVVMEQGEPVIRMVLALWGAQRELREEDRGVKRMVTSARFKVGFKVHRVAGRGGRAPAPHEASIDGDPGMKIDHPERFIPEFPPQLVLGRYDVDLWPSDSDKLEIAFTVDSTAASGGTASASFLWKVDVPSSWKLREGEAWKGATEIERDPDEAL